MKKPRLFWTFIYIGLIPLVNWSFMHWPAIPLSIGGCWAPMAIVTGLILVFRDFAQREVGHVIILPLLIGLILAYFMSPPEIALASGIAFAISEMADYIIYSMSNKPFAKRVLISSLVSAPMDSMVFLLMADIAVPGTFHWITLTTSVASKLLGAVVVYYILKKQTAKKELEKAKQKRV